MCGIAGWIDWQEDLTRQGQQIERMADSLCQRGPDAQGQWLSPHAALAHRRLIVIDPQTGEQPMIYQEGDRVYTIIYNGEIYNFRELRRELVESLLVPLYAHDFPTAGQMTSSLYLLFHAMKQDATVALSGESADEVFGGYPWFHSEAALKGKLTPGWLPSWDAWIVQCRGYLPI